jgi:hypothetical protein
VLGLYYRIWVDFITKVRLQPANKRNWKIKCTVLMTMAMTFNLVLVMIIIQKYVFDNYFYKLNMPFLPLYLKNVLSFLILFLLPCAVINYLLIFRNKRYEKLMKKYPYYNGKLFTGYFLISMFLPILLLWIGIIFFG